MSMANQWFRLYAEFATDPKIQVMSETMQRRYVMALCLRCTGSNGSNGNSNGSNGNSPLRVTDSNGIACYMRVTVEEWEATKKEFIERGLFDENGDIKNWDKRQYISDLKDRTAAERQRRFRANKKNKNSNARNGRYVTPVLRPDTDTDKDTDIKPLPLPLSLVNGTKKKANGTHRGTRLPYDWCIGPDLMAWMIENTPMLNVNKTVACFRDYWIAQPGQKGVKADWPATFRNWCRRCAKDEEKDKPKSAAGRFMDNLRNA